ncbi:MAG: hypothetical protein KA746_11335 [Pyrinomonadaceae bacterium]|nr:hypothetical protein [Pyrinomonadaceae bacterium]
MGYFIRVLGTKDPNIHINILAGGLVNDNLTAKIVFDPSESPDNWTAIEVASSNGTDLMRIERSPVSRGGLGNEELEEFRKDIKNCKPISAVNWLEKYFDKVKVIYAFQLFDASTTEENFPIIESIRSTIWNKTRGILQADNEGFSNENGYHILWQFSDNAAGEWSCSVRNFFGKWTNFTMDLGDQKQREEFWSGKVPKGAIRL